MLRKRTWTLGRGFGPMATFATLCWSPDDPPAPPPGNPPPAPPAAPFAVFPTKESFQERLERDSRAYLKEKYGLSEKQLDERLARAKELEDAETERKKAQQTTEERLKGEKEAAEQKQREAEAQAAEARREAEVTALCARNGYKNVDYAIYEATRSKKSGAELEAHFAEMAKDDKKKSALGLDVPPPEVVPTPGTTAPGAPPAGNPPPPPPPGGGGAPPPVDVMSLSREQFAAHLAGKTAAGG